MTQTNKLIVQNLGRMPYQEAWDYQKQLQQKLIDEKLLLRKEPDAETDRLDYLLFVEHPHVYTLGKSGDQANLLRTQAELKQMQAEFVAIDRGGDITYHGPGQIVGYPILDLDRYGTDLHLYLRNLEEVIIRTIAEFGLVGERVDKLTGVWVDGAKICAMGIKCSRWVTMHGFALNVNTQMDYFNGIVPCGITDKPVCSMQQLLGEEIPWERVVQLLIKHILSVFNMQIYVEESH